MSRRKTAEPDKESPKKVAKKTNEVVETPEEELMYIGPTIVGAVRQSTVFKEGVLPEAVLACVQEFPAMRRLFVPLDGLAEAMIQLKKNSVLSDIYSQTEKIFTRRK